MPNVNWRWVPTNYKRTCTRQPRLLRTEERLLFHLRLWICPRVCTLSRQHIPSDARFLDLIVDISLGSMTPNSCGQSCRLAWPEIGPRPVSQEPMVRSDYLMRGVDLSDRRTDLQYIIANLGISKNFGFIDRPWEPPVPCYNEHRLHPRLSTCKRD